MRQKLDENQVLCIGNVS